MVSSHNEATTTEIRLDKYASAVWRSKWLILIGMAVVAGITAFLAARQPAQYTSVALIKTGRIWKEPIEDPYITERVINSGAFIKEVAGRIGVSHQQLRRAITARTVVAGTRRTRYPILVSVSATAGNADDSARFAQAVATAIIARHDQVFNEAIKPRLNQERRLEERRRELLGQPAAREALIRVETELDEVKLNNSLADANITAKTHLVDDVSTEAAATPGFWRSAAAAGLIAGLVLTLASALTVHIRPATRTEGAQAQSYQHASNR